jgi:hypothetical protein
MSSTVQILVKIIYSYYTRKRTPPFFLIEEEILSNDFYSFKERIINEVPHRGKANAPLQFSALNGNLEVDLSLGFRDAILVIVMLNTCLILLLIILISKVEGVLGPPPPPPRPPPPPPPPPRPMSPPPSSVPLPKHCFAR